MQIHDIFDVRACSKHPIRLFFALYMGVHNISFLSRLYFHTSNCHFMDDMSQIEHSIRNMRNVLQMILAWRHVHLETIQQGTNARQHREYREVHSVAAEDTSRDTKGHVQC